MTQFNDPSKALFQIQNLTGVMSAYSKNTKTEWAKGLLQNPGGTTSSAYGYSSMSFIGETVGSLLQFTYSGVCSVNLNIPAASVGGFTYTGEFALSNLNNMEVRDLEWPPLSGSANIDGFGIKMDKLITNSVMRPYKPGETIKLQSALVNPLFVSGLGASYIAGNSSVIPYGGAEKVHYVIIQSPSMAITASSQETTPANLQYNMSVQVDYHNAIFPPYDDIILWNAFRPHITVNHKSLLDEVPYTPKTNLPPPNDETQLKKFINIVENQSMDTMPATSEEVALSSVTTLQSKLARDSIFKQSLVSLIHEKNDILINVFDGFVDGFPDSDEET